MVYRERLWPTPWLLFAGLLLVPAVILMLAPISVPLAIPVSIGVYLLFCLFLFATSPVIEVTRDALRAGRAEIPLSIIAGATTTDRDTTKRLLSVESDARAFLVIRSWIPQAVRVELSDPADPTPYWLVSSRRPNELSRALEQRL